MMKKCTQCKLKYDENLDQCPHCGHEEKTSKKKKRKVPLVIKILIPVVSLGIVASAALYFTGVLDKVIKFPWKTQEEEEYISPEFEEITSYPEIEKETSKSFLDYKDYVGFTYCENHEEFDRYFPDKKYMFESEDMNLETNANWIGGEYMFISEDREVTYSEYFLDIKTEFFDRLPGEQVYNAIYTKVLGRDENGEEITDTYWLEYIIPTTLPDGTVSREQCSIHLAQNGQPFNDDYSIRYYFDDDTYELIEDEETLGEEKVSEYIQIAKKAKVRFMNLFKEGQRKAKGE